MSAKTKIQTGSQGGVIGCVLVLLVGIVVAVVLLNRGGGKGTPAVSVPDTRMAYITSQVYVRDQLKAPSTADFPFSGDPEVVIKHLSGQRYQVNAYVDSENSFGAMIRTHYKAIMLASGSDWKLESLEFLD